MRSLVAVVALTIASDVSAQTTSVDQPVNVSARRSGRTTEVLVSNTVVTLMPTTALSARKAIELQNLGPNPIYCTVGGETPATDGSLGRRVDAGGSWSLDAGSSIVVRCLAGTADQVSTAATQVTEVR
jgi:hypothetical protein